MAVIAGMTNSFKKELLEGTHDLADDTLKIALYTSEADLTPHTTVYSASGEATSSNYTAGGDALSGNVITQSGSTVYADFDDPEWTGVTFSNIGGNDNRVRGALIYNTDGGLNKSIAVLDFGLPITVTSGTFTVKFPTADANDAIIRIR